MSKVEKDLAKYTALQLTATQLTHQCDARDTLHQFDYDDEFLEEVNYEVHKLITSLYRRGTTLQTKYNGLLPDYVSESQDPNNI